MSYGVVKYLIHLGDDLRKKEKTKKTLSSVLSVLTVGTIETLQQASLLRLFLTITLLI